MQLPEITIASQSLLKTGFRNANQVEVLPEVSFIGYFSDEIRLRTKCRHLPCQHMGWHCGRVRMSWPIFHSISSACRTLPGTATGFSSLKCLLSIRKAVLERTG